MESPAVTENFVTDGHVGFDEWVISTTDTLYLKFLNFLYLSKPKYMAFFISFVSSMLIQPNTACYLFVERPTTATVVTCAKKSHQRGAWATCDWWFTKSDGAWCPPIPHTFLSLIALYELSREAFKWAPHLGWNLVWLKAQWPVLVLITVFIRRVGYLDNWHPFKILLKYLL